MNKITIKLLALFLVVGMASCTIDEINNPNGPTLEAFQEGASAAQLQLLVTGTESTMRNDLGFYYQTVSIVGREYYDLNGTDPRYTGEILGAGAGEGVLDDNGFLTTRSFTARYRSARNAQVLIDAVTNSDADLSDAQKSGYYAFGKFVKAYQLLLTLNRQFDNGVRLDIVDPDNLGDFVSYADGLTGISALLSEAISDAGSAGDAFNFSLSSGFANFDTPATFSSFLQGLKARVELYAGNKTGALSALNSSFFDLDGNLDMGVYHVFGSGGNDQLNPIYYIPVTGKYMAHGSFVADADADDARLSKVNEIPEVAIDGLSGIYQVQVYGSNTDPVGMVRNEELILMYAEANIGSDNSAAVNAINIVRNSAGVGDYSGDMTDSALTDEVLKQRRYSLFGEGHRWIDMRRYDRLDQLPLDRDGDQVFVQFPRPVLEGN